MVVAGFTVDPVVTVSALDEVGAGAAAKAVVALVAEDVVVSA